MKTLSTGSTEPRKDGVEIGGDSKARRDRKKYDRCEIDGDEVDDGKIGDDEVGKKGQNLFKFKKTVGLDFFTPRARLAFPKLR